MSRLRSTEEKTESTIKNQEKDPNVIGENI